MMNNIYLLDVLSDIGDIINVIVQPFKLILDFIGLLIEGIGGIITIFTSVLSLGFSVINILPTPLSNFLSIYITIYVSIMTFRVVKGII